MSKIAEINDPLPAPVTPAPPDPKPNKNTSLPFFPGTNIENDNLPANRSSVNSQNTSTSPVSFWVESDVLKAASVLYSTKCFGTAKLSLIPSIIRSFTSNKNLTTSFFVHHQQYNPSSNSSTKHFRHSFCSKKHRSFCSKQHRSSSRLPSANSTSTSFFEDNEITRDATIVNHNYDDLLHHHHHHSFHISSNSPVPKKKVQQQSHSVNHRPVYNNAPPTQSLQSHNKTTSANSSPPHRYYSRRCSYCSTMKTPMWRHGPDGFSDLCNKCGVKWMRGRILSTKPPPPQQF